MKLKDLFEQSQTKDQIEEWLHKLNLIRYTINSDLSVDVHENVIIEQWQIISRKIPIQFGRVSGNFYCSHTGIDSLKGAPSYVGGSFYCDSNPRLSSLIHAPHHVNENFYCQITDITSLEGAPSYVGGDFNCYGTGIDSLHNIHKQIKYIGRALITSNKLKSNILGVVLIRGLKEITFDSWNPKLQQVINIINKHLKGNRNIHECQEELLEAGLSEYAQL